MTALMPKRRLWMKWGLPYGVVLVAFVWAFHDEQPDYVIAFVLLVVTLVITFASFRKQYRYMPDQVLDGGDFLQVTFGHVTERVPLSSVASMDAKKFGRVTSIVLHLREPAGFGDTIMFYPFQDRDSSGRNAIVVSLEGRISNSNV